NAATEFRHSQPVYPLLRSGPDDSNGIAGFKAGDAIRIIEMKTDSPNRDVVVFDLPGFGRGVGLVVAPRNADEGATVLARSQQKRSILAHALTAQDDATRADGQAAKNSVTAFEQEDRATQAV